MAAYIASGSVTAKPVIRRDMNNRIAAGNRGAQPLRLAQITDDHIRGQPFQARLIAARTRQQPQLRAFSRIGPGDMAADETPSLP